MDHGAAAAQLSAGDLGMGIHNFTMHNQDSDQVERHSGQMVCHMGSDAKVSVVQDKALIVAESDVVDPGRLGVQQWSHTGPRRVLQVLSAQHSIMMWSRPGAVKI